MYVCITKLSNTDKEGKKIMWKNVISIYFIYLEVINNIFLKMDSFLISSDNMSKIQIATNMAATFSNHSMLMQICISFHSLDIKETFSKGALNKTPCFPQNHKWLDVFQMLSKDFKNA